MDITLIHLDIGWPSSGRCHRRQSRCPTPRLLALSQASQRLAKASNAQPDTTAITESHVNMSKSMKINENQLKNDGETIKNQG